jgi:hypothetical protein
MFLNVSDHIAQPHKTKGKIIVLYLNLGGKEHYVTFATLYSTAEMVLYSAK